MITPRPYQQEAIDASVRFLKSSKGQNGLLQLPTGCHAVGTRVVMWDLTTKAVEDVRVDDVLMGPDGSPRLVCELHSGIEPLYRVTPKRGGPSFVVNAGHILHLECTNEGKSCPSHRNGGEIDYISVGEYIQRPKWWRHLRKLRRADAVFYHRGEDIHIDAYMLGVLLGDGCMKNGVVGITTADHEIVEATKAFANKHDCVIRVSKKSGTAAVSLNIVKSSMRRHRSYPNPVMQKLRTLGIAGKGSADKFIPQEYISASIEVRQGVLAGLIDTDGYHDGKGGLDYITKSKILSDQVAFIARSIGITAHVAVAIKSAHAAHRGTYYRVSLSGNTAQIPCRIARKKPAARIQKKNPLRTGFVVEQVGIGRYYGFTLDADHLYLTDDFVIHHNSGKSIVIAGICKDLGEPTLVFQPNKEILQQNASKFRMYGYSCGIYSASAGEKTMRDVTFATIGSVHRKLHLLERFRYVIVDEAHLVAADGGMYETVLSHMGVPVVGMTATPYRLGRVTDRDGMTRSILKFLTRTNPRVFDKLIYHVQNRELFDAGYLCPLEYFEVKAVNTAMLRANSTGADYTDQSVREAYRVSGFHLKLARVVNRLFEIGKRNAIVFTRFTEEARWLADNVPGCAIVTAETPPNDRDRIINAFRTGRIRCVANVGILTTGFDYPELEAVVVARPTMSLALWYQMVGRGVRTHPDKRSCMVVDMGGNLQLFGKVEDLELSSDGGWHIHTGGRVLTGVPFGRAYAVKYSRS